MRARIIALLILIIFVGGPILLYWYFIREKTSTLEISLGQWIQASVILHGTFSKSFLPLADTLLNFRQDCVESCVFSPLPEAAYQITIESPGMSTIQETFSLRSGEKISKSYNLEPSIELLMPDNLPALPTKDDLVLLSDDIHKDFWDAYTLLWVDFSGKKWVAKKVSEWDQIWFITEDRFVPMKLFPFHFSRIQLDPYGSSFLLYRDDSHVILMWFDMQNISEFASYEEITSATFQSNLWHVSTASWGFDIVDDIPQKNVRFSDWVDMGNFRLWYIRSDEESKLALSNYDPSLGSALILVDRTTGKSVTVTRNQNIAGLFVVKDTFYILLNDGSSRAIGLGNYLEKTWS